MAFTYDLSTDTGKVRLRIADTRAVAYAFEDEEIAYFLTSAGSVVGAAYLCVQSLLADQARRVKQATVGDVTYNDTARVAALNAILDRLATETGQNLPTISVVPSATMPHQEGWVETVYTRGT